MSQIDSTEKRISRLEAESEIRKVMYDYCIKQDKRDLEGFLSVFTEDIRFTFPMGGLDVKGKENIKKYFVEEVFANHEYCFHICNNINIHVEEDKAHGEAYFNVHNLYKGEPQEGYGRYILQLRKENGQWKIAEMDCRVTLWKGSLTPQDPSSYERFTLSSTK